MKPFFIFLFLSLLLSFGSKSQEKNEHFPLNNKIIQNQQLDNNQTDAVNESIDLIRSGQDTLQQVLDSKKEKIDSLSNALNHKLFGWQDSAKLNAKLEADTITNLTRKVLDSLNNIVDKTNNALPDNPVANKILPEDITSSSIPDKLSSGSPIPNGQLSPLQNELGLNKLSLPDTNIDQLNLINDLPVNTSDIGVPSDLPNPGDVNQQNMDQLIDEKAGKLDAVQELQDQSGESMKQLDELKGVSEEMKNYGDLKQMQQAGKSLANEEALKKMNELFDQHSDKLEQAQNLMSKLKKKYSYVPNSNDLSTARKANSLEGEPLKKRLSVGGNFKFERGNPLTLDLSPYVLYKINKEFYAGLSASYRVKLNYDPKAYSSNIEDVAGGSAILRHKVYKGFFGYSEFEYRSAPVSYDSLATSETIYKREWVPGLLLGIGKEMTLKGKLKGTVILTYDFLHSDKSFNNSAWNVKFGFALDDLDLKNRKKEMAENFMNQIK